MGGHRYRKDFVWRFRGKIVHIALGLRASHMGVVEVAWQRRT